MCRNVPDKALRGGLVVIKNGEGVEVATAQFDYVLTKRFGEYRIHGAGGQINYFEPPAAAQDA